MFKSLEEMYSSREFEMFIESKLGNDLWLEDSERKERIEAFAEEGLNGSTHREVIEDWREFLKTYVSDNEPDEFDDHQGFLEFTDLVVKIEEEITACEEWHEENKSIDRIIN